MKILINFSIFLLILTSSASAYYSEDPNFKIQRFPPKNRNCVLCHLKKNLSFIPKKKSPILEHDHISLNHGNKRISCNNCHDINKANELRPSVCQQCHADIYRDWEMGAHGKRIDGWNKPQKFDSHHQCIDCHNPHSVRFQKMKAVAKPKKNRFLIEKTKTHD